MGQIGHKEAVSYDLNVPLKEGWLNKQSRHLKKWRRRWVVIQDNKIYTFGTKQKYENPTEMIELSKFSRLSTDKIVGQDNDATPLFLLILTNKEDDNKSFLFYSHSENEAESWQQCIEKIIQCKGNLFTNMIQSNVFEYILSIFLMPYERFELCKVCKYFNSIFSPNKNYNLKFYYLQDAYYWTKNFKSFVTINSKKIVKHKSSLKHCQSIFYLSNSDFKKLTKTQKKMLKYYFMFYHEFSVSRFQSANTNEHRRHTFASNPMEVAEDEEDEKVIEKAGIGQNGLPQITVSMKTPQNEFNPHSQFYYTNALSPIKKESMDQLERIHGLKSIENIRLHDDELQMALSLNNEINDNENNDNENNNSNVNYGIAGNDDANKSESVISLAAQKIVPNLRKTSDRMGNSNLPNVVTIPQTPSLKDSEYLVGAQYHALNELHVKYQNIKLDNGDWIPYLAKHVEPLYPGSLFVSANITQLFIGGLGYNPNDMEDDYDYDNENDGKRKSSPRSRRHHKNRNGHKNNNDGKNGWNTDAFYNENTFWRESDGGCEFVCSILKYSLSFGNALSSIRQISFRDSNLDDYSLEKMCLAIKERHEMGLPPLLLKRLIFNKNMRLTDYSMAILFETIGEYCCNLEEIDLSEINVSDRICDIIFDFYKQYHFDKIADMAALGTNSPHSMEKRPTNKIYNNYIGNDDKYNNNSQSSIDYGKMNNTIKSNNDLFLFGVSLHRIGLLNNKQISMNGINRLNALFTQNMIQENKFSEIISNTWDSGRRSSSNRVNTLDMNNQKRKINFEIDVSVPFAYEKSELIKLFDSRIKFFE